jgi:hypothetical protein
MNNRRLALVAVLALAVAGCATPTPEPPPTAAEPTMVIPTAVNLAALAATPVMTTAGITATGLLTDTGDLTVTGGISLTEAVTATMPLTFTIDPDTLVVLQNTTYTIGGKEITLVDGQYENQAEYTSVMLVPPAATGDLNGDGVDDAAVILADNTGGTGTFEYLVPVIDEAGEMVSGEAVYLGDRVRIETMTIADGVITLEVVTHGPDDPMCCPTQAETWTFQWAGGTLQLTSTEGPVDLAP